MTELIEIGQKILALRKNCNVKQAVLAEKIGVSQAEISQIENGKTNPSLSSLSRIAGFFGVRTWVLLCENVPTSFVVYLAQMYQESIS
jgi:transcriptional regulator with XRE-family HTH domain